LLKEMRTLAELNQDFNQKIKCVKMA